MGTAYGFLSGATSSNSYTTAGIPATLESIIVGTKATSATITVYDGTASTANSICTIDAATASGSYPLNLYCPNGIYVLQTGGSAKTTVVVK